MCSKLHNWRTSAIDTKRGTSMNEQAHQPRQGEPQSSQQADAVSDQGAEWDQTVAELSQSARDAVGMVGDALNTGVQGAAAVVETVGPLIDVIGIVVEIIDAVTSD
jgi:hypothetical protein